MSNDAKFRLAVSSIAIVLVLVFFGWMFVETTDLCGNENASEVLSPSGKWKAVTFDRSCGATTPYITQVRVMKGSEKLGNDAGNIALPERAWSLEWTSNDELVIEYSRFYLPQRRTEQVNGIRIIYRQD